MVGRRPGTPDLDRTAMQLLRLLALPVGAQRFGQVVETCAVTGWVGPSVASRRDKASA